MNNKNIIIIGPAASGKDTLRKRLEKKGFIYCKPFTTRPKRKDETDDDYFFVTNEEFDNYSQNGQFAVKSIYNGWKYGITKQLMETCNLFVMTPEYISDIDAEFLGNSFIIYLNPGLDTRIERLCSRNDVDDVLRRIESDEVQFKGFNTFDIQITDSYF